MAVTPGRVRLVRLIIWRLVISTLLLGSAALIQSTAGPSARPGPVYALIGWTFALSAVYTAVLRRSERTEWLVSGQLALDVLTVTAFVWITGGITSFYSTLFVLPIMAGAALLTASGALAVAGLSVLLYTGMVWLQYAGTAIQPWSVWAPGRELLLPPGQIAQYTVASNVLGFVTVALLSASLADRVRKADARLADASTAIANLQAYNEHIITSLSMGLITTDLAGRVLTCNRAAGAITGLAPDDVIGQSVIQALRLPAEFAATAGFGIGASDRRRADYRYVRADQAEIDLGLSVGPLMTPSGGAGLLFTFQDVTTIRRLERHDRVQQRLAAVGEMAAGLAHEIRNPLASMSGSVQILRRELTLTDEQAQLMDIVLRESERLNQTIRSFLAYARPQRFGIARLDLRPLLQEVALLLRNSAEVGERHIIDVEAPEVPVWCEADEGQVRQIVWNLATNGLRSMPDGGHLRLTARQESAGPVAVLVVQDDGVGMPEDEVDAMFQPFHGKFDRGSGLGMSIVYRIVSDYGGEIRVTSKPGAGTAIEVRLPARPPLAA